MARGAMAAVLALVLVSLVAAGAAGATARRGQAGASVAGSLTACLRRHGYQVSPETAAEVHTAPSRFDFVAVWNLLSTDQIVNRVSLAITLSRDAAGAARAASWTRKENAKLGKGVVHAPVVRFGRIDVLWTVDPAPADVQGVYPCVRARA